MGREGVVVMVEVVVVVSSTVAVVVARAETRFINMQSVISGRLAWQASPNCLLAYRLHAPGPSAALPLTARSEKNTQGWHGGQSATAAAAAAAAAVCGGDGGGGGPVVLPSSLLSLSCSLEGNSFDEVGW